MLDLYVGDYNIELRSSHVAEICALLAYYAAHSGNYVPTLWDNLLVPSSRLKNSWPLKMGPIGCLEMVVMNYHYTLCNNQEEYGPHLRHDRSLKSHIIVWIVNMLHVVVICYNMLVYCMLCDIFVFITWHIVELASNKDSRI